MQILNENWKIGWEHRLTSHFFFSFFSFFFKTHLMILHQLQQSSGFLCVQGNG